MGEQVRRAFWKAFALVDYSIFEFYCRACRRRVLVDDSPVRCASCGKIAERRYAVAWPPPPPAFSTRIEIRHAGKKGVAHDVTLKPDRSHDGTIATVFQEIDKLDPDKEFHRRRKRVINSRGIVIKDVDVAFSSNEGHGAVGTVKHEKPREIPGDPLRVTLGHQ